MELVADTYYIAKIQAGETEYFARVLERYSQPVFSLIVKMTGRREDAEELTQDVFMKVFRSLDHFQGNSSFSTWLYRIAYNTAISALRKRKDEWAVMEESIAGRIDEDEAEYELESIREEQIDCLEKALEQLPPDERTLILLFYMQEKSIEDIAAIMELSVSNVKTKLHRIRKKLWRIMNYIKQTSL